MTQLPEPIPSRRRPYIVALVGLVLALSGSIGASAEEASDLRGDTPPGEEVRLELASIAGKRTSLVGNLARLEGDIDAALDAREALGEEGRRLAAEIEAVRESARKLAVTAFIAGGPAGEMRYLLDAAEASDLSWRQYLMINHAENSDEILARLTQLEATASAAVIEAVRQSDDIRAQISDIQHRLLVLGEAEATASSLLVLADAWDRAEIAIAEGDYGFAPAERWEALRFCESTHDYAATSDSGAYRGAYQFDFATWRTVGGVGDPAAAPPDEQDARARELYARRGDQPWPICGHWLADDDE